MKGIATEMTERMVQAIRGDDCVALSQYENIAWTAKFSSAQSCRDAG